jgi:hypothetical protein
MQAVENHIITRDHSFESKLGYASPARAQTAIHEGDMAFCHWYRKKMSKTITILFLTTGLYGMSYPKKDFLMQDRDKNRWLVMSASHDPDIT